MTNLRKFRTARRLTQRQVAGVLGTTQQTVGRWENGAAEPNLKTLRDLAGLYGTSVDNLVGAGPRVERLETVLHDTTRSAPHVPADSTAQSIARASGRASDHPSGRSAAGGSSPTAATPPEGVAPATAPETGPDAFRGHVGVRLHGGGTPLWYPLSDAEWRRTDNLLTNADPGGPWVCIRTRNNRLLALNLTCTDRLCLLEAGAPRPHEPPVDRPDAPRESDEAPLPDRGRPLAFYKGLLDFFFDPDELTATSPADLAAFRDFARDLDEDAAEDLLLRTRLHRADGEVVPLLADTACLVDFIARAGQGLGRTVRLAEPDGRIRFYPADGVALVDMPLTLVHERYLSERGEA